MPNDLSRIQELTFAIAGGYQNAAAQFQRARDHLQLMPDADAKEDYRAYSRYCGEYQAMLRELHRLVLNTLPEVYAGLRILPNVPRWHDVANFDWTAAGAELIVIRAATVQKDAPAAIEPVRAADEIEATLAATLSGVQVGAPDLVEELRLAEDKTRPLKDRLSDLFRKYPRFRTQSCAALGRLCGCSGEWVRQTIDSSKALREAHNRKNLK